MHASLHVVHSDPDILGGTPVFVGTRVPLRNLVDYIEHGHSLDEFLDDFPTVTREQAVAVLESALETLTGDSVPARCAVAGSLVLRLACISVTRLPSRQKGFRNAIHLVISLL